MKNEKYDNIFNIKGLAMETFGGLGPNFQDLISKIAGRISLRTNIKKT